MRNPEALILGLVLLAISGVVFAIAPLQYSTISECNYSRYPDASTCKSHVEIESQFLIRLLAVAVSLCGFLGAVMTIIATYRLVEA